jgi:hypothetical protein
LVVASVVWQEFGDRVCEGNAGSGVRLEEEGGFLLGDGCSASGRYHRVRVVVEHHAIGRGCMRRWDRLFRGFDGKETCRDVFAYLGRCIGIASVISPHKHGFHEHATQ